MPATPIYTTWYLSIPTQYRDRVSFDPVSGYPACITVAAGAYQVSRELTNTDRAACLLPPTIVHQLGWR